MERALRYDHYKVLGVPRDASAREIKRAYRERVKQWHPDRNGSARASEVFHALHEAYITLHDQGLRAAYDEQLRFYRPAPPEQPVQAPRGASRKRTPAPEDHRPPTAMDRAAFRGLHLTGLLFGSAMVLGIGAGCLWLGWPAYMLLFAVPGLAVIPDSIAGLRAE